MKYEHFKNELNKKCMIDEKSYYNLLVNVIKNPDRYTGIFRVSNAKTKLIQNVTQSIEIKFGDFMENIVTEYIEEMGYKNYDKNIGNDEEGNALDADQVFSDNENIYLIEQKIRDDHDSTKKRGQYENFRKKYTLLKKRYPNKKIIAIMWFIDDGLVKNKNYYKEQAQEETDGIEKYILYGMELFEQIFNRFDIWDEICGYLIENKLERNNDILSIPDFDTSDEIYKALVRLKNDEPALFKKLMSGNDKYKQLRSELFPTNYNLNRLI